LPSDVFFQAPNAPKLVMSKHNSESSVPKFYSKTLKHCTK